MSIDDLFTETEPRFSYLLNDSKLIMVHNITIIYLPHNIVVSFGACSVFLLATNLQNCITSSGPVMYTFNVNAQTPLVPISGDKWTAPTGAQIGINIFFNRYLLN